MDSDVETFDPVIHYKIALLDSASVQWLRYPRTKAEKELNTRENSKQWHDLEGFYLLSPITINHILSVRIKTQWVLKTHTKNTLWLDSAVFQHF